MTDTSQKSPPIKLSHYLSYGLYRGFELLLRPLPIKVVCVIGGILGSISQFLLPSRKRIVIRNLRIAYGDRLSLPEIHTMCNHTYWNVGANLLASLRANYMSDDELNRCVEADGLENLRNAREKDSGLILLLAHMGSWETMVQTPSITALFSPFSALYRPLANPLLDKLVKRRREQTNVKLFSKRDGFFTPIAHLKEKGGLGAFTDQNARDHGISVPLFGKLTSLTSLPALLHRRTGAPIIPVSMSTISNGKWRVRIHPAIEIPDSDKSNAALVTSHCARNFEIMMTESPTDVLWMHHYWKGGRKRPLEISGIRKEKNALLMEAPTKPFNLLIFAGDIPINEPEALAQLHRLKHYRPDINITLVSEHLTSPDVDHRIPMIATEPPHIVANAIRKHDLEMQTPIDCALDFTKQAQGNTILKLSGISPIFSMSGKHIGLATKALFKDSSQHNLTGFLNSLGMKGKQD